jgi:CheY-like chemotaxis protein
MTSAEFTQHIRFALQHLFEVSVLDKGPGLALAPWLDEVYQPNEPLSTGQRLHQLLVRTVEQMKPAETLNVNLPRHRSYLILKRRYIDGVAVQQLENEFSSSSRQFRRESHRAIEELVLMLWNLSPQSALAAIQTSLANEATGASTSLVDFDRSVNLINLFDLVVDAAQTLSVIISSTHTQVTADIPATLPPVTADRVVLRLAIIKLLREAIAHSPLHVVKLHATASPDGIILEVDGVEGIRSEDSIFAEAAQLFTLAEGSLTLEADEPSSPGQCIVVRLSTHHKPTVLVVDDDPAMARIIQRFLALKSVNVLSCNSTSDVLKLARENKPVLILLDVLMPKRDGWEVLQELKANPDTYHINLAVCSIWDERELALALGADLFFQKPIDRTEFLECIEKHLIER